jgi:hypothetical protein
MSSPPSSPVDQLLTLGICKDSIGVESWLNYPTGFNLTLDHVPDLIRIALMRGDEWSDWETNPAFWAPVHAWRALGQLQAEAAIVPLFDLFLLALETNDDWIFEEMPEVYGLIGPMAIPALSNHLLNSQDKDGIQSLCTSCLEAIALRFPDAQDACVAALTLGLEAFEQNHPSANGSIIAALIELKAIAAAPLMERAFAAHAVDTFWVGDWEDVQVLLGLKSPDELPQRGNLAPWSDILPQKSPERAFSKRTTQQRAKNKMAKQSRKKNRKKR